MLLQLPTELFHEIALQPSMTPADLCHLESTCRRLLDIRSDATLWRTLAERRWGPLQKTGKDWRSVLCWLETDVHAVLLPRAAQKELHRLFADGRRLYASVESVQGVTAEAD